MKKITTFSLLLLVGLLLSQILPGIVGEAYLEFSHIVQPLAMIALAFIMLRVGLEFRIDKTKLRSYCSDYAAAMLTAALPWIFVSGYFVFVMLPEFWSSFTAWEEALLIGRSAAPTSAGILLAFLASAGLRHTWTYKKARVLAIFDDLDTILLLVVLKIVIFGMVWQLGAIAVLLVAMLWVAWRYMNRLSLPCSWPWLIAYAFLITLVSEAVHVASKSIDPSVPIHIEVLLPAFVLGCSIKRTKESHRQEASNENAATYISAAFLLLVGLNMPPFFAETTMSTISITASQNMLNWNEMLIHVLAITLLGNVGKMVPFVWYRNEKSWRERLALSISLFPRGEVGSGVIVLSLGYGLGGPVMIAAVMFLVLNLVFTGLFIAIVVLLLRQEEQTEESGCAASERSRGFAAASQMLKSGPEYVNLATDWSNEKRPHRGRSPPVILNVVGT